MFGLDGRLLGLDLETDSPDPFVARPVSYALAFRRSPERISYRTDLVIPEGEIPEEATAIHGITTERARAEGVPLVDAMAEIKEKLFWAQAEEIPLVGMNISFDLTIVHLLADLSGWDGNVLDVFVIDKQADRYRKGSRKLGDVADHYGVELPEEVGGKHSASGDAVLSILVVEKMALKYPWLRKAHIDRLHQEQIRWERGQRESLSAHFVSKGQDPIDPKEFGWPIKDGALASKEAS